MNQKSIKSNFFTLIIALFFTFAAAATAAQAATYTVDTTADDAALTACTAAAGDCSLRGAIANANGTAAADTINFAIPSSDAGCTAGGVCTITLTLGQLQINDAATAGALTITNSTGASNLLISGNNTTGVFLMNSGSNLTLNGLTVTKGYVSNGYGGGIYNYNGSLTITNSAVSGNASSSGGGGIFNYGTTMLTNTTVSENMAKGGSGGGIYNESSSSTLSLTNSIVSGNTATNAGSGGGIFNSDTSTTTLTNSTVSGNMATNGDGGGIYITTGTLTLTNSTVSGNTATINSSTCCGYGGGIYAYFNSKTTLTNSTVSGNMATSAAGGGIFNDGTLTLTSVTFAYNVAKSAGGGVDNNGGVAAILRNTIVAKNTGSASAPDFYGAIDSPSTFNLIGDGTGMTGITNSPTTTGNQVGTTANPIDPKLDPTLALNGGTTPNHALLYGSPAIDQGSDTGTDQRGFARPVDLPSYPNSTAMGANAADIGAYEAQTAPLAPTAASVAIGGQVTTPTGRGIRGIILLLTDSEGNIRTATTNSFGYYQFADVQTGETYILSATGKHYTFNQPIQVLNVNEETNQIDFIANSEKRERVF